LAVFSKARSRVDFQGMTLWGSNSEVIKSEAQHELIFLWITRRYLCYSVKSYLFHVLYRLLVFTVMRMELYFVQSIPPHPTCGRSIYYLPSTPGSLKLSLSLTFPHQNPVYTSPLPPYALHALPISFFSILSPEQYCCFL